MADEPDKLTSAEFGVLSERIAGLKELFNQSIAANKSAVDAALAASTIQTTAAFAASEKAVAKAEVAQHKVNEGQNEFRGQLRDQAAALMPRAETELLVAGLRDQIGVLRTSRDTTEGKSTGVNAYHAQIVAAVSVVVAIISLAVAIFRH